MPLYPIFFILVVSFGFILSLVRGPIYGLITYVFVYFNIPSYQWWGGYLPDIRWSFISAILLSVAVLLHQKKVGGIKLGGGSPATYLVLLLLLMVIITPFSYSPEMTWGRVYDFFRYVYIYFLVIFILVDHRKYRLFLYSFIFNFVYLAYLANSYFKGGRLDGVGLPDASDANMFAALLLLVIPFLLQFLLDGSRLEKGLSLTSLVLIMNAFIMCGSRGGLIGLIAEFFLFLILQINKKNFYKLLIVAGGVVFCFLILLDPVYKARLLALGESVKENTLVQASVGRVDIWRDGLKMLQAYPLGTGGGGFMALSPIYIDKTLLEGRLGTRASHNTFLLILVEQGPIGFTLYAFFIFMTLYLLLKIRRRLLLFEENGGELNGEQRFLLSQSIALFIALIGFCFSSFFIDRIYFECIYLVSALGVVLQSICVSSFGVGAAKRSGAANLDTPLSGKSATSNGQ